jgi:hypothetical protein
VPEPDYQVIVNKSSLVKEYQPPSPLKNLDEQSSLFEEKVEAVITFVEDGKIEEYELKLTTSNLGEGSYYTSYGFSFSLSEGQSLELLSNTCNKVSNKNSSDVDCTASNEITGNKYSFKYNYKLYNDEYITIIYKYKILKPREILYRQEAVSISAYEKANSCSFKYIIPDQYISLGLKDNLLTKESDNEYSYKECPINVIKDIIRFTPKESYWKANVGIYLKTQPQFSNDISLTFPQYYKGGKITNKFYKLMNNENMSLKESDYIHNEIKLKVNLSANNKKNVGVEISTAFSNKLSKDFSVYASEQLYKLEENIDEAIKAKAQEIMNDLNPEPLYKKIGKFVYSYIQYDLQYHGRNLTASQIYTQKKGVCEHYTILYNLMLNAVGIKTIKVFGWAFQKEETTANENTIGHAWTAALIDGKWKELDATWGLFDGIPSGHILKGYDKETVSYSYTSTTITPINLIKTHNIQLIDNLDNEKEDDIRYHGQGDEEEGEANESTSESNEKQNTEESSKYSEETIGNQQSKEQTGNVEKNEEEKKENKSNYIKFKKLLCSISILYFLL